MKLKKVPINVTSNQKMHKSAELKNNTTSFTHIVMRTMPGIYHTDDQSPPQFTSSMVPSSTGDPRNNMKFPEAVHMQKKEQYTQEC